MISCHTTQKKLRSGQLLSMEQRAAISRLPVNKLNFEIPLERGIDISDKRERTKIVANIISICKYCQSLVIDVHGKNCDPKCFSLLAKQLCSVLAANSNSNSNSSNIINIINSKKYQLTFYFSDYLGETFDMIRFASILNEHRSQIQAFFSQFKFQHSIFLRINRSDLKQYCDTHNIQFIAQDTKQQCSYQLIELNLASL
jgi:hypothetical protein